MDPDANLKEALELANCLACEGDFDPHAKLIEAERLADLLLALDEWITKGGFLPERWRTP